jgi:adenylate cyclase
LTTSKKKRIKSAAMITTASLIFTYALFLAFPSLFESWNLQTVDRLFILRSRLNPPKYDSSIVHINITNSTIEKLSYYFPRRYYGEVISALSAMDFHAIAFDILFAQHLDLFNDSIMISAVQRSGKVYFPVAFSLEERPDKLFTKSGETISFLDSTQWNIPDRSNRNFYHAGTTLLTWPVLSRESKGIGFISAHADKDGVFRRVPLLIKYKNGMYPSLALKVACDYLKISPDHISLEEENTILLRRARYPTGEQVDIRIPIDDEGNIVINWIGGWEAMRHLSFGQILDIVQDREELEAYAEHYSGSIGIVGDISTGISDVGPTPFEENFPLVGLHANTLNTILTRQFLRTISSPVMLGVECLLACCLMLFALQFSSVKFTVSSLLLVILYFAAAAGMFIYGGYIVQIIQPIVFCGTSISGIVAYWYITEEKEKEKLRSKFETYFPPAIVKQMIENPNAFITQPQRREITIMFSDIKSFTTYSSTRSPEEISTTLNEYFGAMTEIVFTYGGTVDKFIGDGLMVFYGAPEPQPDHALRCVKAAIEMQKKCRELKALWEPLGRLPLKVRIGINTGEVVVGDLGSAKRMEYTVLGSNVNLAQRLESNAPVEGILISDSTYHHVKNDVPTRKVEPILVKGLSTPITVYEVLTD